HSDFLDGPARERLRKRAMIWLTRHIRAQLKPLMRAQEAMLTPAGRGLLFQLVEALGTLPRRPLAAQLAALTKADRKTLAALGVRYGAASLFMPKLQHPRMLALRARLWAVRRGCALPDLPQAGAKTFDLAPYRALPALEDFCHALGYRLITRRDRSAFAVRADVLERLAREVYQLASRKPAATTQDESTGAEAAAPQGDKPTSGFTPSPALCALADCSEVDLEALLFALGYRRNGSSDGAPWFQRKGPRRKAPRHAKARRSDDGAVAATAGCQPRKPHKPRKPDPREAARAARREAARLREEKRMADSPFAILRQLTAGGE